MEWFLILMCTLGFAVFAWFFYLNRKRHANHYGMTMSGKRIVPPIGYRILSLGEPIPLNYRRYVEGRGWEVFDRQARLGDPVIAHAYGPVCAMAVKKELSPAPDFDMNKCWVKTQS